jgi:DNA helicase-2/ATP-dependent DNA helicase PcrA
VAVTRAAYWVACCGYWWGEAASPLGPSVFLEEVRAACAGGAGTVAHWEPPPDEDAQNPALAEPAVVSWPAAEDSPRQAAVREAAALVARELARMSSGSEAAASRARGGRADGEGGVGEPGAGDGAELTGPGRAAEPRPGDEAELTGPGRAAEPGAGDGAELTGPDRAARDPDDVGELPEPDRAAGDANDIDELGEPDRALARAWTRDASLLLTELARRRAGAQNAVPLPGQLSVSSLVTMAADPDRLAQQIRRPMPRPPVPQARRGTAFHRWLEQRFGQQRLIDPADLLGAADDPADDPDDADLALLRERFEAGEWGDRWPVDVEVPFETLVAGRTVRGRIDAVFADPVSGDYDVVDWKTGEPPASAADLRAASVQLAAYRIAWARLAGVPLDRVRAGFYYVRHDQTLRPADLLDETGLAALVEDVPLAHGAGTPGVTRSRG